MATDSSKAEQYKAGVAAQFNTISASHRKWWPILKEAGQEVSDVLIARAVVVPGNRVLDIGTGVGEPALTAARVVGDNGHVIGIDIAPEMLEIAIERAMVAGAGNVRFQVGDAEELNFAPASFDAVISRNAFQFIGNLSRALGGVWQILDFNGRLAFSFIGAPSKVPTRALVLQALEDVLGPSKLGLLPRKDQDRDPAYLKQLIAAAGFVDVHTEYVTCPNTYPNADAFVQMSLDLNVVATANPGAREALHEHMISEIHRYPIDENGHLTFENEFLVCTALRP